MFWRHGKQTSAFQIDFESLIRVLGENLYANPKSAVRELIQNANDSCVRRVAHQAYGASIQIETNVEERLLTIEDNGEGMVRHEVIRYLASIGGGRTREARKQLMTKDPEAANMLIGQFGIGFLSSFVVANQVIVDSLSMHRGPPVRWVCEGTAKYDVGQGDRSEPGTKVTLVLKPGHYELLEEDKLREIIVRYADLISLPIFLNKGGHPVNRMNAPWHYEATEAEYSEYIEHRYGVAPLALERVDWVHEDVVVHGVIFIPPRDTEFKRRLRSADLFQKRMYVGEDLNILPDWAGFVCAVLDCPTLDLVASREAAIRDRPSYKALQQVLAESVTAMMTRLAERERATFTEVIHQHDWAVLSGAVRNDSFFEQVKDLIPIPSDMGPLTLPKYIERVPERPGGSKTLYYVSGEQLLAQQQSSLFRARGVPVFHADMVAEQFLTKYAEGRDDLSLRQMLSGVVELMEYADGPQWRTLEARFQDIGIVAKAVKFYPPDLAAMAVRQSDYDQERLIEQVIDGKRALLDFMTHATKEVSDAYGLCFNVDNPIIVRLAEYQGDDRILNVALRTIHAGALLAGGVEFTTELSQEVAQAQIQVIETLLEQAAIIEQTGSVTTSNPEIVTT